MSDQVVVSRSDGVCEIQLNRPEKRNAITLAMYGALVDALNEVRADDSVRVVLVSGAGASFTAGKGSSQDFTKTMLQARDLAKSQNLEIGAPKAPSIQNLSGNKRAAWKLSGTGAWDAVDKWLSAMQSTDCPLGLTSLFLASGPDGKLRLEAEAISYSR